MNISPQIIDLKSQIESLRYQKAMLQSELQIAINDKKTLEIRLRFMRYRFWIANVAIAILLSIPFLIHFFK